MLEGTSLASGWESMPRAKAEAELCIYGRSFCARQLKALVASCLEWSKRLQTLIVARVGGDWRPKGMKLIEDKKPKTKTD